MLAESCNPSRTAFSPNSGAIPIWKRNGNESRNAADASVGGDAVNNLEPYDPANLNLHNNAREIVFMGAMQQVGFVSVWSVADWKKIVTFKIKKWNNPDRHFRLDVDREIGGQSMLVLNPKLTLLACPVAASSPTKSLEQSVNEDFDAVTIMLPMLQFDSLDYMIQLT